MAQSRFYSNTAVQGAIGNVGGISAGATSMFLASTPVGYPNQFPFTLELDTGLGTVELVSVSAGAGTSGSPWTISRSYDGSTASAHAQNATVKHVLSAGDETTSRLHEAAGSGSGVHGLPLAAWQSGAFAIIGETTLSTPSASVSWTSIPQTYAHLLVVLQARSDFTGSQTCDVSATVNADSAAKYSNMAIDLFNTAGSLSAITPHQQFAQTSWAWFMHISASQGGSSVDAGSGFALIPNYSGATFGKQFVSMSGFQNGTTSAGSVRHYWGGYIPTTQAGITQLALGTQFGNFIAGSFFGLYGIGG